MDDAVLMVMSQRKFEETRNAVLDCPKNAILNVKDMAEVVATGGVTDGNTAAIAKLVVQEADLLLSLKEQLHDLYDQGYALSHNEEGTRARGQDAETGSGSSGLADILGQLVREYRSGGEGIVSIRIPTRLRDEGTPTSEGKEAFSQEGEKGPKGKTRQIVIAQNYEMYKDYCKQEQVHPASMTYQESGSVDASKMRSFKRGSTVVAVNMPVTSGPVLNMIVERNYLVKHVKV
jgi:hypothetical protein